MSSFKAELYKIAKKKYEKYQRTSDLNLEVSEATLATLYSEFLLSVNDSSIETIYVKDYLNFIIDTNPIEFMIGVVRGNSYKAMGAARFAFDDMVQEQIQYLVENEDLN